MTLIDQADRELMDNKGPDSSYAHAPSCYVYINARTLIGADRRGLCTCGAEARRPFNEAKVKASLNEEQAALKRLRVAEAALCKARSRCPEGFDARIQILVVRPGYAHCLYEGTCEASVTLEDLARLFAHPQWGARAPWIRDGRFSIIRHLD